ncbi:MAG: hypothetical protein JWP75_1086 [Frondihabitans sp.]|nr:hypothetical protein [Frondihabitans sp.]
MEGPDGDEAVDGALVPDGAGIGRLAGGARGREGGAGSARVDVAGAGALRGDGGAEGGVQIGADVAHQRHLVRGAVGVQVPESPEAGMSGA